MKSVTDALIDNFHSGNQKYVTLNFSDETALTNEEIVIESLGIEQTICDETALVFGNVYAGAFSIQIFDRGKNYKGLTVDVSISVDEYSMSLGSYIITSNPVDDNTGYRTLVGYDRMYPILRTDYSAWHYALPDTVNTIKKFRDAFFQEIGITQQAVSLVNDNVPYTPMVHEGTLSGAEILKAILETNGMMGYLDFDQTFHYVTLRNCTATDNALYPSMTLYPSMGVYPASADATSEVVSDAEEKVLDGSYLLGGLGYERYMTENYLVVDLFAGQSEYTAGTTGLTYTVQSNILTENMGQTEATACAAGILSVIADVTYTPTTLTMLASPWIELGDVILVKSKDGTLVAFPVLHRSMSGITFLKDTYEALGIETEQNNPNTVKQQIIDAKNFASQYATKYLYETEDGDLIQAPDAPSSDTEAATMTGYYTKIVSSGVNAGFDVYEGDGTTNQRRVAHYGADAVIGAEDEAHVTIGASKMCFSDGDDSVFFAGDASGGSATRTVVLYINLKSQDPAGGTDGTWSANDDGYWGGYAETSIQSITSVECISEDGSEEETIAPANYTITFTTDSETGKQYLDTIEIRDPNYDIESDDYPLYYNCPIVRITAVTTDPNIMYHMQEEPEAYVGSDNEAGYGVSESGGKALGLRTHAADGGTALAPGSWAVGPGIVSEFPNSFIFGKYNKRGKRNIFAIGNGTDETDEGRADVFSVTPEGRVLSRSIEFDGAYEDISDSISINDEYISQPSSSNLIVHRLGCFVQVYAVFESVYNGNIPHSDPIMYGFPKPLFPMTVSMGTNTSRVCPTVIRIDDDGNLCEWYGQYIQNGNTVRVGFMYICAEDA